MTAVEREEQTRNFAAGNVGLENQSVTRAVVDEASVFDATCTLALGCLRTARRQELWRSARP
jgi:hypothetical protein